MTDGRIEVTARNENGASLHVYSASSANDAARYIVQNAAASFVHGFTVEGVGILTVQRGDWGGVVGIKGLVDGGFGTIAPNTIEIGHHIADVRELSVTDHGE